MKFDFSQQPGLIRWNRNLKFDGKPLVSIITAFYNAGKYFQQTYNSVMDQTFPWFEWIIVDDGSTDEESLLILNKLASSDQRIKVIHQANAGAPSARNTGILNSTTDYIFPLDSDDLIEPTCLEYNFWALYFNPKATWSYSDSVGFQNEEYLWDTSFDPERMKKTNHLVVTALIRKQAALDVGGYSIQEGPFDEDWHFWLKLLAQGAFPVQIKGEYLFWYRRSENGVYASVHNNLQNNKRNKKIISEQAAFVIAPEKPVIYPTGVSKTYTLPVESKWKRSIYKEHHKIHILCLFPWLSMGGADKFCEKLNFAFEQARDLDFVYAYSGGYVSYANQPGCSNAHIFAYGGKPWLTQYWVRQVKERAYGGITPDKGYGGHDEDEGQMGGVSALMALGLFSVTGTESDTPYYDITSPIFDKITIKLNGDYYEGSTFTITTHNNSAENCYIQRAQLNGMEWNYAQFNHADFTKGGKLELWLGNEPNKSWGKLKYLAPDSDL